MQTTERWFMREALKDIWSQLTMSMRELRIGEIEGIERARSKLGAIIDRLELEDERESKSQGGQ